MALLFFARRATTGSICRLMEYIYKHLAENNPKYNFRFDNNLRFYSDIDCGYHEPFPPIPQTAAHRGPARVERTDRGHTPDEDKTRHRAKHRPNSGSYEGSKRAGAPSPYLGQNACSFPYLALGRASSSRTRRSICFSMAVRRSSGRLMDGCRVKWKPIRRRSWLRCFVSMTSRQMAS